MNRQHPYSLTLRLALIFALLAFALLATLGVALYTVILCVVRSRRFGPEGTAGILRLSLLCL